MEQNAVSVRRRKSHKIVIQSDDLSHLYPHDINLYQNPPTNIIEVDEFEDLALERLQLFRIIEEASIKKHIPYSDEWRNCIKEDLLKAGLKKFVRLMSGLGGQNEQDLQARRADHLSHFILRLSYCRSEEMRRYFLNRELDWLRTKFSVQNSQSIKMFLHINDFDYEPISRTEKESIKSELCASTYGLTDIKIETTEYYKVRFAEVVSLVKNRKVFLQDGYAYIPTSDLIFSIQSKFRSFLSEALNVYFHKMPYFSDERINGLLVNLHNIHTGNNYNTDVQVEGDRIDPANLDHYSKKHYPLCMKHLHDILKSSHHLKHGARLQYRLFLKGIGLLYEDAMKFWREEFTKNPAIDENKFEKNYAYDIKHAYGKVGRQVSYSPFSCIKIITGVGTGGGDQHGCPFKHWDNGVLKQKLQEQGITKDYIDEISDLIKNGHYQIACGKYFEATHGKPPTNGINHPNQYFEESMSLEKSKK